MKKKQIMLLIGCLIFGTAVLLMLYAFSPLSKEIKKQSFSRKFPFGAGVTQRAMMNIEYNSFYIAGLTNDHIYLGNVTAPLHLLITNTTLTDSQHVNLKVVGIDSIVDPGRFRLAVEPPYFFMSHGIKPVILRGKTKDWTAKLFMPDSGYFFVESVPMDSTSFALRSYSMFSRGYELAKRNAYAPYFQFNNDLLQKQVDGLFCVEGRIHYNKVSKRLVYLHSYRNEFIVTDSNLNLLYRGHTIDTFRRARIKVEYIESKNQYMAASPPPVINANSCITEDKLFVQSNLPAKNEDLEEFMNGSVIDVYNLGNGDYSHSFYIPNYNQKRLSRFQVYDDRLVAIFDRYLGVFELSDGIPLDTQTIQQ